MRSIELISGKSSCQGGVQVTPTVQIILNCVVLETFSCLSEQAKWREVTKMYSECGAVKKIVSCRQGVSSGGTDLPRILHLSFNSSMCEILTYQFCKYFAKTEYLPNILLHFVVCSKSSIVRTDLSILPLESLY